MRRVSAPCAEKAAGTAAFLIKEFNQEIVSDKEKESRYCVKTVPAHGCVSIVYAEAAIEGIGYGSLISASSS